MCVCVPYDVALGFRVCEAGRRPLAENDVAAPGKYEVNYSAADAQVAWVVLVLGCIRLYKDKIHIVCKESFSRVPCPIVLESAGCFRDSKHLLPQPIIE